jgi:hypothetical protein
LCAHHETSLIEELVFVFLDEGEGLMGQLVVDGLGQTRVLLLQNLELALHLLPAAAHPRRYHAEIAAELSQQIHQRAHFPLSPPRPSLPSPASAGRFCLCDSVDEGGEGGECGFAARLNLCVNRVSRPMKDTTD